MWSDMLKVLKITILQCMKLMFCLLINMNSFYKLIVFFLMGLFCVIFSNIKMLILGLSFVLHKQERKWKCCFYHKNQIGKFFDKFIWENVISIPSEALANTLTISLNDAPSDKTCSLYLVKLSLILLEQVFLWSM